MPVSTAVRAVVRTPGKAAPFGVLCLQVRSLFLTNESNLLIFLNCEHCGIVVIDPQTAVLVN